MKGLREKFRKNSGFTLVEMLIVVAIIAILIAVSIPLVTGALERARIATDSANERSAIGAATVKYLASEGAKTTDPDYLDFSKTVEFAYKVDGGQGELVAVADAGDDKDGFIYGQCSQHKNDYIIVTIEKDGNVTAKWSDGGVNHAVKTTTP